MRTLPFLIVAGGLAACSVSAQRGSAPTTPRMPPEPRPAAAPLPAAEAETWPDATSFYGDWTLRLRPLQTAMALTEEGPAIALEATLVTDDPDVLFAGGPRASMLTPTADLADDPKWMDEDRWSGMWFTHGKTATVHLPHDPSDARPVDIQVRCRLMRVDEWTTHDLDSLGPGEHDEVEAAPYFLSVDCYPDEVIVSATLPRESRAPAVRRLRDARRSTEVYSARTLVGDKTLRPMTGADPPRAVSRPTGGHTG